MLHYNKGIPPDIGNKKNMFTLPLKLTPSRRLLIFCLSWSLLSAGLWSWHSRADGSFDLSLNIRPTLTARVGNIDLRLWLACTPTERRLGLKPARESDMQPLADGRLPGMIFVYSREYALGFTMREMDMDLDLALFNADGELVHGVAMRARVEKTYFSPMPARYGLEMPPGSLAASGLRPGDRGLSPDTRQTLNRACGYRP